MQQDLPIKQDEFRLVRITQFDARNRSDDFLSLRQQILASEESYPGIAKWFDTKVSYGLTTGERCAFVGLVNEVPTAAAILKRGERSKFCHLRIEPSARSRSLGDLFFSLMALEIRQHARRVRFTLPESVWEGRRSFFNSFSFQSAEKANRQYRLFDTELYSETTFSALFDRSKEKIPQIFGELAIGNHSLLTGAVLAIQPRMLEKIFSGQKSVEIRTRFSSRWENRRVSLYATSPISGISGEAKIARVIEGAPNRIWEVFGHLAGCSRAEFTDYVRESQKVFAIVLKDVRPYIDPVPLTQLTHLLGVKLAAPQSYLSLENNDGWLTAVALAAALQGSIGVRTKSVSPAIYPPIQPIAYVR